jgi:hypothetical protein
MENLPVGEEQWANETIDAMKMAFRLMEEDVGGPLDESHKEDLHKYAPILAAYNRDVQDKSRLVEMVQYVVERQRAQASEDVGEPRSGELKFVAAYLDAHVALDVLDVADVEKIMQYVTGG